MAYLALYRKYRPTTFDEVIGQSAIVTTLRNQIKNDKVGHAYLFTGTRGTGKTSVAKIFARAVNCENPQNGSPCNKCAVCGEMLKANNIDIIEIDAASNNKVDEIRELRENAQYPPTVGKRKVYIIDEVHMLTDSAFNALLKTLEEPPVHVLFILATTEAHKVPQTIVSRCMRFDFSLVAEEDIVALMRKILVDLKIKADDDAVSMIARSGAGSVRDALSILDKCVAFCETNLTAETVSDILGISDSSSVLEIVEDIINNNVAGVLTKLADITAKGKSVTVLNSDILKAFRDILILESCDNAEKLLLLPSNVFNRIAELSKTASRETVLRCIDILSNADTELRYSINPKVILESTLLRCARPQADSNIDALLSRISVLENAVKGVGQSVNFQIPMEKESEESPRIEPNAIWGEVLRRISDRPHFYTVLRELETYVTDESLVIKVTDESDAAMIRNPENGKLIREIMDEMGVKLKIKLEKNYSVNKQALSEKKVSELFGDKVKKI